MRATTIPQGARDVTQKPEMRVLRILAKVSLLRMLLQVSGNVSELLQSTNVDISSHQKVSVRVSV